MSIQLGRTALEISDRYTIQFREARKRNIPLRCRSEDPKASPDIRVEDTSSQNDGSKNSIWKSASSNNKRSSIRGVNLETLQTSTNITTLSVRRQEYSQQFRCALPDYIADIEVVVTNDYWACEEWCDLVSKKKPKFLGMSLYHRYLPDPPVQPHNKVKPKKRFRMENKLEEPPPIPPGGPLLLPNEGSVIALMVLSTELNVLILQLHHMKVVGPILRELLENPFICKCGKNLTEWRKTLRRDGLKVVGVTDAQEALIRTVKMGENGQKTKDLLRSVPFNVLIKSATGVDTETDVIPQYTLSEEHFSADVVTSIATEAWSCWAMIKVISLLYPENVPLLCGITPKRY